MRTALVCTALLILTAGAAAAQSGFGDPKVEAITVSPRLPTAGDPIRVVVTGQGICGGYALQDALTPPGGQSGGNRILLRVSSGHNCSPPVLADFAAEFHLGPLPAGTWTLAAVIDEEAPVEKTLEVDPASTSLLLQDGLFRVSVQWSTPDGALHGEAQAVPLSKESGYLWFFQGSNPEILVKILDGNPVNGHWWVFISSNTNLEFRVKVEYFGSTIDPPGAHQQIYVSPAGANKNFIDTTSF